MSDITETVEEFYQRSPYASAAFKQDAQLGDFAAFPRNFCPLTSPFSKRSFYKVALVLDPGKLFYANRWIDVGRPALQFSNPMVPYAWESESPEQSGWFCLFTEYFLQNGERTGSLADSPFFKTGGTPVFFLDAVQEQVISDIFRKMIAEMQSSYAAKFDVLRNYLHLLMHEAIKLQPRQQYEPHLNAATRVASLFLELMERQFPVHFAQAPLKLKSAGDYANQLSVHVNSLNRAVKQITGKTTTQLIAERIAKESVTMLRDTDWNIAEIAYALGFEEPNNFTSFFKKHTGETPGMLRRNTV
ncbi:helix-turn-helix domain-containing protein [Mucilaginibacter sp. CAU 1740]|uniref:helix-turn-helix domain-containing protein n=1 Tax=Mucilaginibacter sp. CAU 1740 TaxID=3140365 RepID=UPI00325A6164